MQRITCPRPQCGKRLKYGPEHAGKRAKCQKCGHSFRLPGAGEVASAEGESLATSSPPAVSTPAGNDPERMQRLREENWLRLLNATPTTARGASRNAIRMLWRATGAMLLLGLIVLGGVAVGVLRGLAEAGVAPLFTAIGAVVLAFGIYFAIEEMR